MRHKTRITPFARFLIFALIAAPLIYLGSAYINGEDGVQNIKQLLGIESTEGERERTEDAYTPPSTRGEAPPATDRAQRIEQLEARVQQLTSELEDVRAELRQLQTAE